MPETKNIVFTYKEVAEALVRKADIHEGLWGLYMEFGIGGANIGSSPEGDLQPAAIVAISKLGIQRFEKPNNLTVDASEVNPEIITKKITPKKKKKQKKD